MKLISLNIILLIAYVLAFPSHALASSAKKAKKYYDEAYELQNTGHPRQAIKMFNKVLKLKPDHYWAINNLALCYHDIGEYDKALASFERIIDIDPMTGVAHLNRGLTYESMGEYQQAFNDYLEAARYPESSLDILYSNIGLLYGKWKGDYDSAIIFHNKAIEENPEYYYGYTNRAAAHRKLEKYDLAKADLEKAKAIAPESPDVLRGYGHLCSDLKMYDLSIEYYTQAVEAEPNSYYSHYNRGWVYIQTKEYKKGLTDFEEAIKANPAKSNSYLNRGLCLYYLGQYNKAIEDFKYAIDHDDNLKYSYNNMANAYHKLGQPDQACQHWQNALNHGYEYQPEWKEKYGFDDPKEMVKQLCQ